MNRRSFIARTLAALAAVVSVPRRLFAAPVKPIDLHTPFVTMRACNCDGDTLSMLSVKTQPESNGANRYEASGYVKHTGVIKHFDIHVDGVFRGQFPLSTVSNENAVLMESGGFATTGGRIDINGTFRGLGASPCNLSTK